MIVLFNTSGWPLSKSVLSRWRNNEPMSNNATHHSRYLKKIKGKWQECVEWLPGNWRRRYIQKRRARRNNRDEK